MLRLRAEASRTSPSVSAQASSCFDLSETVFSWLSSHLEQVCYGVMLLTAVCMLVLYHLSFRKDRADTDPKAKAGESDEA